MKLSQMTLHTLREAPSDAEAVSHQLLVRGGFIRRLTSGVYSYLPLGLRVLSKVSQIIREEFDAAGAQEMLLPALHPLEIWEETGRTKTMDDVLMRVHSKAGEFVLGPTHEEAMIATISPDLSSYRDLPATLYQIQTKFRDEPRARFGLMRTREFIMADAYSFDIDQPSMNLSYRKIYEAYHRAFRRMGLPVVAVEADSGAIGGDVNHEFMSPSPIGEDHFSFCQACGHAANIEAARRGAPSLVETKHSSDAMTTYYTPHAPGVSTALEALEAQGQHRAPGEMLKCIACINPQDELVLLLVPGDREARVAGGLRLLSDEELVNSDIFVKGFIGPMGMINRGVTVIADHSVALGTAWATGANSLDHHVVDAVNGRDFEVSRYDSVVVVEDGDPCPVCGSELELIRGVEIGHTFQLGLTYSSKISQAKFTAVDGSAKEYYMGCYGIGVTRLIAVIVEHFSDDRGVQWPLSVAPFQLGIYPIGYAKDPQVAQVTEQLYRSARELGLEVLLDDRALSPGVMFADAELLGLPYQLVVGSRELKNGRVELRDRRSGATSLLDIGDLDDVFATMVAEKLSSAGNATTNSE